MPKTAVRYDALISCRISRELHAAIRSVRERGEIEADTLRRLLRAGVDVMSARKAEKRVRESARW